MSVGEQGVRNALERVLESPGFARNERLSRFLRFVVERHLDGKDDELKESVLAIEVFSRRGDFDPKQDPVVRTEAGRLRARLSEYYVDQGKSDPLVIELPKGGYIPQFRKVESNGKGRIPAARWALAPVAAVACLVILTWWWIQHRTLPIPIAVLPLENTSHDPADDYFADGLTDELIRNLSIIEGLAVRSRTSSFAYKNRPRNMREEGQQLRADYILEGSVLRAGQRLRIDVQLVRVRDDFSMWSGKFDRELTDVFAIQEEISLGVVNHLRLKLGLGRRRYESSVEAYDLYLRARAIPDQRSQGPAREAAGMYERVIAKDPNFAPAYAGLAAAYAASSAQSPLHHERAAGELAKMRTAAEKAIQLDPLLAEAYDALGMVYARDGQWAPAEKSFRHAIELDPDNAVAYADYTMWLLLPVDRRDEALEQMRIAENTDPLSPRIQHVLGLALLYVGKYEEATVHCQKGTNPVECVGRARLAQGRIEEAIGILSAETMQRYLGYAYGRARRREEAYRLAAAVAPNPFSEAIIYAGLGDKDRTLEALDRASEFGAARIGREFTSPEFSLLRGDARANALRKRVGLPE